MFRGTYYRQTLSQLPQSSRADGLVSIILVCYPPSPAALSSIRRAQETLIRKAPRQSKKRALERPVSFHPFAIACFGPLVGFQKLVIVSRGSAEHHDAEGFASPHRLTG